MKNSLARLLAGVLPAEALAAEPMMAAIRSRRAAAWDHGDGVEANGDATAGDR